MLKINIEEIAPTFPPRRMGGFRPSKCSLLPVGRNVSEMIRQTKAFQHVGKTGEAIPSG